MAALVLTTGWLVLLLQGRPASSASPGDLRPSVATTEPAWSPTPSVVEPPNSEAPTTGFAPTRLRLDALGIDAGVVPIATSQRVLVPPADPSLLGWWGAGARPGSPAGTALLTGHTVHSGGGELDDLEDAEPGDRVSVGGDGGHAAYVVSEVLVLSKAELSARAGELFDVDGAPRLVLITCEDWNGSGYDSNVVVVATPVAE